MRTFRCTVWVLLITFVTIVAAPAAEGQAPIKVGYVGGLSGYLVHLDTAYRDGIQIAIERANRNGGVLGRQLALFAEDNKSEPSFAVTAVQKLLTQSQVDVLTGGCSSASTPAIAPLIQRAEIVAMVCTTLVPIKDADQRRWLFNTSPDPAFDIKTRFAYFKSKAWTRVALLHDTTPYAKLQKGTAERVAAGYGLTLVAVEQYSPRDTDISPQLTKLRAQNPQVIMQVGGGPAIAIVAKNIADLNLKIPHAADFTVQPAETYKIGGAATNNMIFPAMQPLIYDLLPDSDPRKDAMTPFIREWRERFGRERDPSWGGLGYDGMTLLIMGLKKAGKLSGPALREAMESVRDYHGASGVFGYGPEKHEGISSPPFTMVRLENGRLELLR